MTLAVMSSSASATMQLAASATAAAADPMAWSTGRWLSLSSLDLLLLPPLLVLCLFLTLPALLSLFAARPTKGSTRFSPAPSAFVVPAFTRHARFLPRESAHRFKYNTLYLAVRLDSLESHAIDTGHAFAWKGSHFDPEWQDESRLAAAKLVRSGSRSISGASDTAPAPNNAITSIDEEDEDLVEPPRAEKPSLEEWKASMRRSERKERRSKEEKRRKVDATTWAITALHPESYLRNDFDTKPSVDAVGNALDKEAALSSARKAQWLQGSILLKLAYELRERGYLRHGPQDETGLAGTEAKWSQELGQVWTVTMPAVFGIKGINPLTVHYCYRPVNALAAGVTPPSNKGDGPHHGDGALGDFWLVVLEVHNTFNERHVYILEAGVGEDKPRQSDAGSISDSTDEGGRRRGYDHQWTFPRSFHVSPFNDRGGYYRLFLRDPFPGRTTAEPFVLGIRLLLLIEGGSEGQVEGNTTPASASVTGGQHAPPLLLEKKLMASLDSYPATHDRRVLPLTALHLYMALLRQPFDLFLTFARILFEAGKLHFAKKLDAFGRPDMVQTWEGQDAVGAPQQHQRQHQWDGQGIPPPLNRIQPHRKLEQASNEAAKPAGGLLYPAQAAGETAAKRYLERFAQRRVEELGRGRDGAAWSFKVVSTDPADDGISVAAPDVATDHADSGTTTRELVLYTRSGSVYTDLLLFRDARVARLVGSLVGRRWGVNDVALFETFFGRDKLHRAGTGKTARWIERVQRRHLRWSLDCAIAADPSIGVSVQEAEGGLYAALDSSEHTSADTAALCASALDLDAASPTWSVFTTVLLSHLAGVAEERAFHYLGARYVRGTEPWLELQRGIRLLRDGESVKASWDLGLGSVRR
ncbi:uncharacterized protein PFL1_05995 [Pseudozyma flocculosa PF-1]|uniref:Uncharacterized protein n=2 Tax=Pseudozyma flocculosa TaxID=84751 RepID=A0A5C3F5X4_9BASI|nr:uncharacterized protein PFL1_05995 [Pseudozyma flocculosa PF-1]EPQ26347.1 hypothetical protein PFL1_05995 [Pseudozyma flocculosa PF-1]SPO39067.1 uncharacterized protein PSFLO_04546 [Pseudozyma flocculosa]